MRVYSARRGSISPLFLILPLFLFSALGGLQMLRGVPAVETTVTVAQSTVLGQPRTLPLPSDGAAIVAVTGLGTLGSSGPPVPRPIASITKMMTARIVLKDHPLHTGETGPVITTTAADAARYQQMLQQDQSALPVNAGMKFSELELLQGMLVPSANNFAEILAAWDAGSQNAFVAKMNAEARALGMTSTTYADTSGFSPKTESTTQDQLLLARAMMQDSVFASIVSMRQVRLPGIGAVNAVNLALGKEGIVGIKTGFTEEAGGNLAFAARRQAGNASVEVLGLVLGQTDKPKAFDISESLVAFVANGLQDTRVMTAGQPVATASTAWGAKADVLVAEDVSMLVWPGLTLTADVEMDPIKTPLAAGSQVGWLVLKLGEQERKVPLKLARKLSGPDLLWKLSRT